MKRKTEDTMVQSAVWLPRKLHQRLRDIGGERGLGEEIRKRLEASFETEKAPANPKLQQLLDAISYVAGETARYCGDPFEGAPGDPFEDAYAFEVLRISVESLLASVRPKGDVVLDPNRADLLELTLGATTPKDISMIFVSDLKR